MCLQGFSAGGPEQISCCEQVSRQPVWATERVSMRKAGGADQWGAKPDVEGLITPSAKTSRDSLREGE